MGTPARSPLGLHARRAARWVVFAACSTVTAHVQNPPGGTPGVSVQSVQPGSVAAIAGLEVGDVLVGWRSAPASDARSEAVAEGGALPDGDAFDRLVVEVAPRTAIRLDVRRGADRLEVPLPVRSSRWGVVVQPSPEAVAQFDEALAQGRRDDALGVADRMLAGLDSSERGLSHAVWRLRRATVLRQQGQLDAAAIDADAALDIRRKLAAGSWDEAEALAELARIAVARRRLDEAHTRFEAALAMVGRSHSSIESVRLGFALADVEWRQGRLPDAERRVRALLAVSEDLAPDSVDQARNYNLLGILRSQAGDLPAAERAFRASREIHSRHAPGGMDEATALNNLGIAAMQRGRYAEAESFYRQSLAIKDRLRGPPLDRMSTVGNLGLMSIERGDLESARAYLDQALGVVRAAAPGSLQEGGVLSNLARSERLAGRLPEARRFAEESLAIRARLSPDTVLHAFTLVELGKIHEAAGALDAAAAAHRQALDIRERLAPDGSNVADSLDALARIATRQGDRDESRRLHHRAGALWQRVAPGSVYEGLNLVAQARLEADAGRADAARERYSRAVDIFDGLTGAIGGAFDTQAEFRARLHDAYTEFAALLLARGEVDEAFHVTERARARVFLAMLAERDVVANDEVPPELEDTRRALASEYERIQSEVATLSPARDAARIDERVGRMRDVRLRLAHVQADIARTSPLAASVHSPARRAAEARALLPRGTLAISYLVGERASHAFVLSADGLETFGIPMGRARLDEQVSRFVRLVARPDGDEEALADLGADLFRTLVAPAGRALDAHERLLIVPDGPLHVLPFAALVREPSPRRQYLVEWRSLHQVPSLTAYAWLASRPAPRLDRDARVLAVGDPVSARAAGVSDADSVRGPAAPLPSLPGSRHEVDAIGRLYGRRASRLVGEDATEARVRAAMAQADIVHLAVHGLVNARFPLDSALVLTAELAREHNGLLQAWEVFEQVRLRAKLVVLSACQSTGDVVGGGEGLIGLARAFQFAGAPSVVATLWRVPDETTPTLMREFHRGLQRGRAVDDALARAQRAMLRSPSTTHPYHWAAFVLSGRH